MLCWLIGLFGLLVGASGQAVGQGFTPPPPAAPPAGTTYSDSNQNFGRYVNGNDGHIFNAIGDNIKLSSGVWVWAPAGAYNVEITKIIREYTPNGLISLGHQTTTTVIIIPQPGNQWKWIPTVHGYNVNSLNTHRLIVTYKLTNAQGVTVHTFGYLGDFRTPTSPQIPGGLGL